MRICRSVILRACDSCLSEKYFAKVCGAKGSAKTLLVSLAGVLIIAGSFFVSGEMINRMIIIAFGVIVTISGTSSIIGKSK